METVGDKRNEGVGNKRNKGVGNKRNNGVGDRRHDGGQAGQRGTYSSKTVAPSPPQLEAARLVLLMSREAKTTKALRETCWW